MFSLRPAPCGSARHPNNSSHNKNNGNLTPVSSGADLGVSVPLELSLDLDGIRVDTIHLALNGELHIHVSSRNDGTVCPNCKRVIHEVSGHGNEIKLRHLPVMDRTTYIFIRPRWYICRDCMGNPVVVQRLSWYDPHSHATKAYSAYLLKKFFGLA